jgi:hypothetical protein
MDFIVIDRPGMDYNYDEYTRYAYLFSVVIDYLG